MARGLPIAVPSNLSGGRSGSAGRAASTFGAGGVAGAGLGGGGRREAENSGRSRVTESESMEIRDNGLPRGGEGGEVVSFRSATGAA